MSLYPLFFVLTAAIPGLLFYLNYEHMQMDDAYIIYTYVNNFLNGKGLVFNNGERIWGFTSVLQTLILIFGGVFRIPPPLTAFILSFICFVVSAPLILKIALKFLPKMQAQIFSFFILVGGGQFFYFTGLETTLLAVLLLLAINCALCQRFTLCSFILSLACLTRPDAVLFYLLCVAALPALRTTKNIAVFCLPGAIWLIFSYYYYGVFFPNSLNAKQSSTPFITYFIATISRLASVELIKDIRSAFADKNYYQVLISAALSAVFSFGFIHFYLTLKAKKETLLINCMIYYPLALTAAYSIIGAPLSHTWEVQSAVLMFSLSAILGVACFIAESPLITNKKNPFYSALFLICLNTIYLLQFYDVVNNSKTALWMGGRHFSYKVISAWLTENVVPGASVAMPEVGTVSYLTDSRYYFVDLFCIVTKPNDPSGKCAGIKEIDYAAPDYVLYWNNIDRNPILQRVKYQFVKKFDNDHFLDMALYKKVL